MEKNDLDQQLISQLVSEGVDLDRMIQFLNDLNAGKIEEKPHVKPETVPDLSHPSIIKRHAPSNWSMKADAARDRFRQLGLPFSPDSLGTRVADFLHFDENALRKIGIHLYPVTAFGLLNGGCATSYIDRKKNRAADETVFEKHQGLFENLARKFRGIPKGLTPAYLNSDGSPGYSFLLLKLRMILEHKKKYRDLTGAMPDNILPTFQITSFHTDKAIQKALRDYVVMDELKVLADSIGCSSIEMFTETQAMMAAITHSSEGYPRRIFDRAYGKPHTGIAIPGGHGQNFENLAPIYRKMYAKGIRYVWLGNIDNMGYTIDPVSLAIFALSGKEASFEVAVRTSVDVKGGILVGDSSGRLTCADIGPALGPEDVRDLEAGGKPVLFNCGIGLFDLGKLIEYLPQIPAELPFRITDQDKDAGLYAQVEQITWEVIGLLQDPLFFAVEKKHRFIAAKMLLDTIMTSFAGDGSLSHDKYPVSASLHTGLNELLSLEYGLVQNGGCWRI